MEHFKNYDPQCRMINMEDIRLLHPSMYDRLLLALSKNEFDVWIESYVCEYMIKRTDLAGTVRWRWITER